MNLATVYLARKMEIGGITLMEIIAPILNVVLGIVLLTTGKKLYWLMVGVVGFFFGLALATQYLTFDPPWLIYIVALVSGVLGAVLGIFLQRFAISLVGFIVGGYGALYVAGLFGFQSQPFNWMAFIVGGIVGLFLVASVFDWALYILSSWAGATLITRTVTGGIGMEETLGLVIFFVLFIIGMILQAGLFKEKPKTVSVEVKPEALPPKKAE
jgi:MFS family permease